MTPEAAEGWRIRARSGLLDFVRWMYKARSGSKWIMGRHHRQIEAALLRVYAGQTRRLVINIPPRYSKTEFAINFMAWCIGQHPDSEWIYTSFSSSLATKATYQCRELVQHEEYRAVFPHVRIRDDSSARGEWRTTAGGCVYAAGMGGTLTGFGAGKMRPGFAGAIIIDDPHKADEATSDVIRGGVLDWYQNTLESRVNSPETPIIVIMQRLHEQDLAGWLLGDRGRDMRGPAAPGGNGETWEHLMLPALSEDGLPLWEFKHSADRLRQMEEAAPYVFAGQYMQRPAPLEGGLVKPDRLVHVDAVPAGTEFVRGWDLASTVGGGDWTAGVKLGKCPDGRYIIADAKHAQEGPDGVRALLLGTANEDGAEVRISIPQDPGQAGKTQSLDLARILAGFPVSFSPESGHKILRAQPLFAQINVGNVLVLNGPWVAGFKDELRMFPDGKHDDRVDAAARAFAAFIEPEDSLAGFLDGRIRFST